MIQDLFEIPLKRCRLTKTQKGNKTTNTKNPTLVISRFKHIVVLARKNDRVQLGKAQYTIKCVEYFFSCSIKYSSDTWHAMEAHHRLEVQERKRNLIPVCVDLELPIYSSTHLHLVMSNSSAVTAQPTEFQNTEVQRSFWYSKKKEKRASYPRCLAHQE